MTGWRASQCVLFALLAVLSLLGACLAAEGALGAIGYKSFLENGNAFSASWPMKEQICGAKSIAEAEAIGASMSKKGFDVKWRHDPDLGYVTTRNAHGFNDSKKFDNDYSEYERFMVLGDSFTYGMSADQGRGWVDLLNQHYVPKKTLFFNTGIPGYGQLNQLAVLKKYQQTIRPHGVILLFCLNDPDNNRIGSDRKVLPGLVMDAHEYDDRAPGGVARITDEAILERYKRNIGCMDENLAQSTGLRDLLTRIGNRILLGTRLGRAIWIRILKKDRQQTRDDDMTYATTEKALSDINDYLKAHNIAFHAAIVPELDSLKKNKVSDRQKKVRLIFEKLSIPVLDIHARLSPADYVQVQDGHWNNSGHQRVYEEFKSCLDSIDRVRPGGLCK